MPFAETVRQQTTVSDLGTIGTVSASIPFDYTLSSEISTVDYESTSSNESNSGSCKVTSRRSIGNRVLPDSFQPDYLGTSNNGNIQEFITVDMIPLQNMNNVTEEEKMPDKEIDLESDDSNTMSATKGGNSVQLEVIQRDRTFVPRVRSFSEGENSDSGDKPESIPNLPPQVQIRLYRNKSNGTKQKSREDILKKHLGSEDSEQSSSMPDLKSTQNSKIGLLRPSSSKLRNRFQRSKSVPVLNVVLEEKENRSNSNSSCDSIDNRSETPSKKNESVGKKRMFVNKKPRPSNPSAVIAQHRKRVSFSSTDITDDGSNNLDDVSVEFKDNDSVIADSKKQENEDDHLPSADSSRCYSDPPILSVDVHDPNSEDETTIKVSKRSHFRGGQFSTLSYKYTTVLPRDEIAEKMVVIKDATDVLPVDNGGTIVTDILSSKMVLFDDHGYPKITFAMENGSEPWSVVVTPDNGSMAATLKGEGCVCLWSPKGESQTDFGQGILSTPTGICFDRLGRFVVADEGNNAIYLFSRTGNFIGEFINQEALHPFVGNKTMQTLNQPRYISVSRDNLYFVSDSSNQVVKIFDEKGTILKAIGSYGREDGQFRFPYGVAFDEDTRLLYVADHFNNRVSVFSLTGTFLYHVLTQADGITRPKALAIRNSKLYVTFGNLRAGQVSVYRIHANREGGS